VIKTTEKSFGSAGKDFPGAGLDKALGILQFTLWKIIVETLAFENNLQSTIPFKKLKVQQAQDKR
jgi:hypothetical protein